MTGAQPPLRTVLFAPGDDRRKIDKALGLGASAVMLDLEDAVAASQKAAARAITSESALASTGGSTLVGVRINSLGSGLADADLDALGGALSHIALITLPMVESADEIRHVAGRLDELERAAGVTAGSRRPARDGGDSARRARRARDRRCLTPPAHADVRARRPRPRAGRGAHRRGLRAPPRPLGCGARGARRRQGRAGRRPVPQPRRRPGLRRLGRLGPASRVPGQGRAAPAPAADRGRRIRARRARAGLGARGGSRLQRGRGGRGVVDQARRWDVRRLPDRGART